MAEAPGRWQVEKVVLWFWVGRRFGNGGFLEAASALTRRCSRPRYRAAAELEALGWADFSLHPDRLSGLLAVTLFVLAGSSWYLLAKVIGTCGWGAIKNKNALTVATSTGCAMFPR